MADIDDPVWHSVYYHYNLNSVSGRYRFDTLDRLVEFCEDIDLESADAVLLSHLGHMFDATNCAIHDYSRKLDNERKLWDMTAVMCNNRIHNYFNAEDNNQLLLDRLDSAFKSVIRVIDQRLPDAILFGCYLDLDM